MTKLVGVSDSLYLELKDFAQIRGATLSSVVGLALFAYMGLDKKPKPVPANPEPEPAKPAPKMLTKVSEWEDDWGDD